MPEHPVFFTKPPTTVIGHEATIEFDPALSSQIDWEVEMAFVIGTGGRDIPAERALEHVFGYTAANDISARDLQMRHGGQFFKGKSLDTFCPIGPWIETELDPSDLRVRCEVDEVLRQEGSTRDLIHDIPSVLAFITSFMTLLPGDVVLTGTPSGVGPIRPGQQVDVTIEGLGTLTNTVTAAEVVSTAGGHR